MTIKRHLQDLGRDERGIAVAFTALLGAVFVLVSVIVVVRAVDTYDSTNADRGWEEALFVSEEGANQALFEVEDEAELFVEDGELKVDLSNYSTVPAGTDLSNRAAIVAAADTLTTSAAPDGEYVIVKPEDLDVLYGVGYSPTQDAGNRKVRVVELYFSPEYTVDSAWTADLIAFLTSGDLDASSSSAGVQDDTGNSEAHIHANGDLALHPNFGLDGCGSGFENSVIEGVNCPAEPPFIPLPSVNPIDAHYLSMFDLCPNGQVRAGPAHPVSPSGSDVPCTGALTLLPGWSSSMQQGVRLWKPGNGATGGVIYVHGGNVAGKLGKAGDAPLEVTLLIASTDTTGECQTNAGHLALGGNSWIQPHPSAGDLAIAAGGDVRMVGGSTVTGLTMAHEQIYFSGGTGTGGAAVAESACHHPGSPVGPVSTITGGSVITYSGSLGSPFTATYPSGGIVLDQITEITE